MESKMRFDVACVRACLVKNKKVYTVRTWEGRGEVSRVEVDGIGVCIKKRIRRVISKEDLAEYLDLSGFSSIEDWWAKIRSFGACEGWLFEVTITSQSSSSEEATYEQYVNPHPGSTRDAEVKLVTLVKMPRFEGKHVTIFPKKFPIPVVCSEFCGRVRMCHLRENGFSDLCRYRHKLGKLVMPGYGKWPNRFDLRQSKELKARMQFVRSTVSGTVPEIAFSHERIEDRTFAAYSAQGFLDTWDDPQDGCELEYTMDTGMVSPDKSQAGAVPSFMYRTTYRDRRILLGFETRSVERTYVDTERRWIYYPPIGRFILTTKKVIRTTSYREDFPVFKWIRIPTLRPIGCYLKPMKVIGSTTVMTHKEQRIYKDRREVERQKRAQYRSLIRVDEMAASAKVPLLVISSRR